MGARFAAAFGLNSEETQFFAGALRCTVLPVFGLLFYFAHGYLADFFMDIAHVSNVDIRHFLLLAGSLLAPAIAAFVFAYPIGALFPRHAVAASLFIGFPSMKISFGHALQSADKPFWLASSLIALVGIGLLLPYAARFAQSRLPMSANAQIGSSVPR